MAARPSERRASNWRRRGRREGSTLLSGAAMAWAVATLRKAWRESMAMEKTGSDSEMRRPVRAGAASASGAWRSRRKAARRASGSSGLRSMKGPVELPRVRMREAARLVARERASAQIGARRCSGSDRRSDRPSAARPSARADTVWSRSERGERAGRRVKRSWRSAGVA